MVHMLLANAMQTVNIHAAKTHLSRPVDQAAAGEKIVIAKAGVPVAKLVPLNRPRAPRVLGLLAGRLHVPDDFDAPLPEEVLRSFEKSSRYAPCRDRVVLRDVMGNSGISASARVRQTTGTRQSGSGGGALNSP